MDFVCEDLAQYGLLLVPPSSPDYAPLLADWRKNEEPKNSWNEVPPDAPWVYPPDCRTGPDGSVRSPVGLVLAEPVTAEKLALGCGRSGWQNRHCSGWCRHDPAAT